MSRENVEAVRRLYRAMDSRDLPTVEKLTDPDAEWVPDARVGEGPVRGRGNFIGFLLDRVEMFGQMRTEIERVWEKGDSVLTFVRLSGQGAASGAPFDIRIAHLWTLRDGIVVRGEGFGDRDQALEAAGLRE